MADLVHAQYDVDGGPLHALRFGPDRPRRTVLALHGITATSMAWAAVADALPDNVALIAPDLRGRGRSRELPGPWGMDRHVADVVAVARRLADESPELVLAGHSMGAFVAVLTTATDPELFDRLILVDGGVPLTVPAGADPDERLAETLGPALERLRQVYPSEDAYVDFFRSHPAIGPHWNTYVDAYARNDALPTGNGVRSTVVEDAVRADGRDLIVGVARFDWALRALSVPTETLTAPMGMFGQAPGLLSADAVASYDAEVDVLTAESIPDVNHYTIMFDPAAAARIARAIAGSAR